MTGYLVSVLDAWSWAILSCIHATDEEPTSQTDYGKYEQNDDPCCLVGCAEPVIPEDLDAGDDHTHQKGKHRHHDD
jgi:hypothetical protein